MFANRISYWVDGKGPSYYLDYSCTSSTAALEHAYRRMRVGECDAAVVGGCNLCINPFLSLNMKRAGLLCSDGKTKCFDQHGDGYVRSDAVSLIFLQKVKDAKRVYAELCYVQGSYQLKDNDPFLPIRKSEKLQSFFDDVYSNVSVDPKNVEYVEANGSGLAEADENEAKAIANTFTRDKGVKIGSVKSNMGHSEAASGLCALTKLCLAYHTGEIPANLHCEKPVQPITDGRVEIIKENTKFQRGYSALNNLSLTGADFHVVLNGHFKEKKLEKYNSEIPRIVFASGRQESCVRRILDDLKSKQVDAEEIALLHNIFQFDIVGHTGRGYTILDTIDGNTLAVSESVDYFQGVRPPLWFVYSGMGSQWAGMGADLMRIPIFAAAIKRCDKVLSPEGIDIAKVITEPDKKNFDNSVHPFVGITAIQMGLTDILKEMGVAPDYIIGHSLGEMACAYHDDTLTTEELILASYSRAKSIIDADLIKGSMAAVGMGYKALVKLCPPEIDIACHNSSESSTISGPAEVVKEFVDELTKRGIFAKSVPSANIAFHSRYIVDAGTCLLPRLKDVIKNPKLRSKRWISTSVPKEKWDEPEAKYSSAEYYANNLLNPVLFEEITRLIPDNAVVIEIAPHGLLQAILKRSHPNCTHIPLTRRGQQDGVKFLLDAIEKLYLAGYNPKVDVLYPRVEFPVSTETPLLSHLVEWEHSEDWPVNESKKLNKRINAISRNFVLSIYDDDYKYLEGHIRNCVNVLPEAAFLMFVWETLAMYKEKEFRDMSVIFKDIQFHSEVTFLAKTPVRLAVQISKGSDAFVVTQDDKLIVSGIVRELKDLKFHDTIDNYLEDKTDVKLTSQDIYKELKMRGFDYRGSFRSILQANLNRNKALLIWTDNWILLLDSLIQLHTFSRDVNGMSKPKFIGRLSISNHEHQKVNYEIFNRLNCYDANLNNICGVLRCAGVKMENVTYTDTLLTDENVAKIFESRIFFPFFPTEELDMKLALKLSMQIITENSSSKNILLTKVVGDEFPKEFDLINEVTNNTFLVNTKIRIVKNDIDEILSASETYKSNETNVIVIENILKYSNKMKSFNTKLAEETFIISFEDTVPELHHPLQNVFNILSSSHISHGKKNLVLMKTISEDKKTQNTYISISHDDAFTWVPDVINQINMKKRIVLISDRQMNCGILGFVQKLKADGYRNISAAIIDDSNAPKFDFTNDLFKNQLQKLMTINVLKQDAIKCVAACGCFLDFSKQDFIENKNIGMSVWHQMTSYITVDIVNIFRPEYSRDRKILQTYIAEGIKSGAVKPLKRVVFSPLQVNEAMKMVSLNKHTGKVLVRFNDSTVSRNGLETIPRISFSSQDVLIIVCDERGIAIEVTDKLITRGARKIVLHMQSPVSGYLHTKLLMWSKQEVSINFSSDNLQTKKGSETLMKNAMKFGKVKGIFVVLDSKQTDNRTKEDFINAFKKQSLIVMNLNIVSKNSIDPSHFVVISRFTQSTSDEYALSLIDRMCDKRNEMGLPMLVVRYESLTELDNSISKIDKIKPQTVSELFNAIETGLKLKLKNVLTCHLSKKDDKCNNETSDYEKGMYTFYKYLDTEEDNVTSQKLVKLPTLLSTCSNSDWDSDDSYIILIPGFEGRPQIFESMAERLKMRAIVVKLGPDLEIENIQTIALNAREELKRRHLETNKKFYLLGYSFGVNISLELAAILEKEGNTGIVHCIDSSPDAMQVILQTTLGEVSEDQLQNHVLSHMCKLITGENNFDMETDLMKLDSYEEKVEECLKGMKGIVNYSIQYKKHVIESAYKRIIIAREYKPEIKLKSQIVLMKSSVHHNIDQLADDYGLSKYTEKPVKVFNLEADHATAPFNVRVPNIVNQFADNDILKKFIKMNLCDVYLI